MCGLFLTLTQKLVMALPQMCNSVSCVSPHGPVPMARHGGLAPLYCGPGPYMGQSLRDPPIGCAHSQ